MTQETLTRLVALHTGGHYCPGPPGLRPSGALFQFDADASCPTLTLLGQLTLGAPAEKDSE